MHFSHVVLYHRNFIKLYTSTKKKFVCYLMSFIIKFNQPNCTGIFDICYRFNYVKKLIKIDFNLESRNSVHTILWN